MDTETHTEDVTDLMQVAGIDREVEIMLTPEMSGIEENRRNDWLYLGLNALRLHATNDGKEIRSAAFIGSGNGIDAIAGIDLFEHLGTMYVTDILPQIMSNVYTNIVANVPTEEMPETHLREGRDCEPIFDQVDLIYANLPLVMATPEELAQLLATTTLTDASAYESLSSGPDDNLRRWSLLSQLGFLISAKEKLNPDGRIITLIGGRVPDSTIDECFQRAGLQHERTLTGFMRQSDPEFLEQYAAWEQREGTEFLFFHYNRAVAKLEKVGIEVPDLLLNMSPGQIRNVLTGSELNAQQAYREHRNGRDVGHLAYAFEARAQ